MPRMTPGGGLPSGTMRRGWIREDDAGEYVPCGCGRAVQRPDEDVLAAVQAEYDVVGVEVKCVFVCEREECERRTVQKRDAEMEADR